MALVIFLQVTYFLKTIKRHAKYARALHFHLIRHWFGTTQYHKNPDLMHVQKLLGHRNILATQIYVNLDQAIFGEANDEYHVKVAETVEEATNLIAVGYEYVSTMENKQIYRKRK